MGFVDSDKNKKYCQTNSDVLWVSITAVILWVLPILLLR